MIGILTLGAIALGLAAAKRKENGIGRVKRRIYRELSIAQGKGVDFTGKYFDLTSAQMEAVKQTGEQFGWKQTKRSVESGKSYGEAYYNSLKRAYNAISGVAGIGDTRYNVRNADGKIILTWHDLEPAVEHLTAEPEAAPIVEEAAPGMNQRPVLTKQQQILEMWPYLKTRWVTRENGHDVEHTEVRDDFSLVVWKQVKNQNKEVLYEGPMMAFMDMQTADYYKPKNQQDKYNGGTLNYITYQIRPLNKINLSNIAGIGGLDEEMELWDQRSHDELGEAIRAIDEYYRTILVPEPDEYGIPTTPFSNLLTVYALDGDAKSVCRRAVAYLADYDMEYEDSIQDEVDLIYSILGWDRLHRY